MRAIAMGLGLAVLVVAGSRASADPGYGPPPYPTCNPSFYVANGCCCWYGPNYCFNGPCLPPAPFGGVLPAPQRPAARQPPVSPQALRGMQTPYFGGAVPPPGTPLFPTHPFAHGPRDYFMFGQEYNY